MNLHGDLYRAFSDQRFRQTVKRLGEIREPVLDIGCPNKFSGDLRIRLNIDHITNTIGDLNDCHWRPDNDDDGYGRWELYKTVFCFEVIEHLMSPWMMLKNLQRFIATDADIYLTYPRRIEPMWTHHHFHEYSKKRFRYMLNDLGYTIKDYDWWWYHPLTFPLGIRPLIRMTPIGMTRQQFYRLRYEPNT